MLALNSWSQAIPCLSLWCIWDVGVDIQFPRTLIEISHSAEREMLSFPGQSLPLFLPSVGSLSRPGLSELITAISGFHSKVPFSLGFILFWLSSPRSTNLFQMFILIVLICQLCFLNPGIARLSHHNHSYFVGVASEGVPGIQMRRFEIMYLPSIPCSFLPL